LSTADAVMKCIILLFWFNYW